MGWNFKVSVRGRYLMQNVTRIAKYIDWGIIIFAVVWAIVEDYSFFKGILFVAGIQVGFILFYAVFLYLLLLYKETQWRKEASL